MSTIRDINVQATIAQSLADNHGTPFLVVFDGKVDVISASLYTTKKHGAVERVRYPKGYVHPHPNDARGRLW